MQFILLVALVLILAASAVNAATTYRVTKNGTGTDDNVVILPNTTSYTKLSDLISGDVLKGGDIVEIGAGTYTLSATLKINKKITLKVADSTNKPTLKLADSVTSGTDSGSVIYLTVAD
ncbi:MAG: hypothetical protein II870_01480, partial [Synergistaceae bacterium]|nr:hypothetical protein [Synergistaceae bacterium]